MNLQRREEIRAIAAEFRRLFLHGQAEAIDELLAHIDTLEQAAAERVIADGGRGPTPGHAGEGMVAVDREELYQLRGLESCARAVMAYDGLLGTEERNRLKRLDAIRANQGGAAT